MSAWWLKKLRITHGQSLKWISNLHPCRKLTWQWKTKHLKMCLPWKQMWFSVVFLVFRGAMFCSEKLPQKKHNGSFSRKIWVAGFLSLGLRTLDGITSFGSKSSQPKNLYTSFLWSVPFQELFFRRFMEVRCCSSCIRDLSNNKKHQLFGYARPPGLLHV